MLSAIQPARPLLRQTAAQGPGPTGNTNGWKKQLLFTIALSMSWIVLNSCKTASVATPATNASPLVSKLPPPAERTVTVHGTVVQGNDSTNWVAGIEVVFRSLSADSGLEARSGTTNSRGQYQVAVTERPLYQVDLRKDGKTIELLEVPIPNTVSDSNGVERNFFLPFFEPDEDYYQRRRWPTLYFEAYRATLRPQSRARLDTIAVILRNEPRLRLVLEGHADKTEVSHNLRRQLPYSEQLGQQRVLAAVEYLRKGGVSDSCLRSFSYGSRRPAAPGNTPEERQFNRRVEVKVAYTKGVEDSYGDLKSKFAPIIKKTLSKPVLSETHAVSPPMNRQPSNRKPAMPKSGKKAGVKSPH